MFEKDHDGMLLLKMGGELIGLYEQYKEQYVEFMARFVDFAQEAYKNRQNEIKLFKDLVDNALEESVKKSKDIVDQFEKKKKPLVDQMNEIIQKFTSKQATIEELEPTLIDLGESFNEILYDLWKNLMMTEMQLYEQCEESRVQFAVNIAEMITQLMEESRNAFGAWRESEGVWSMSQFESLSKNLGKKNMLGDVPLELHEVMMDRDLLMNLVAQSTDNHMRFIDARDDLLTTRAAKWMDDLVQGTNNNEIKRNRDRILEINYFIDTQREDWTDMQMGLTEIVDPETAALLGDDF
ncbi:hypothetical protein ACJJTC_003726 [Scirpophaga incertulas]